MFITDVVEPAALTGYVREEVSGSLPFAGIFPVDAVDDIEYELENIDLRGSAEVARYRTWDTVPDIGKRPGIRIIGGEIPPLGWSYRLNEKDLGRIGRMRQGVADRTDRRVVDVIFDDAKRASEAVQNRLTIAHAELLQTGAVLLRELGDVADPEAGMQATFAKGLDLSENGQALDAIRENPPGQHFLGTAHTLANFETAFYRSETADNSSYEQWLDDGALDAAQRANRVWKDRLAAYEPPPIDAAVDEELRDYIARRKADLPDTFA